MAAAGLNGSETFPYTPKWTYSFGIQYDYDLGPGIVGMRFDGSYRSAIFTETGNSPWSRVDSRFLGNARLSYTSADDDWRVSLEVQNLFDKYYFLSVSDVSKSLGAVTAVPGLPRTWALTVRRNFGGSRAAPAPAPVAAPEPVISPQAPVPTYKQCLDGSVVTMETACAAPPPPVVAPQGERG